MQILALKALREFWTQYPAAERPLRAWYRLVVRIVYDPYYRVMVKFVGTHEAYDAIDPETV